MVENKKNSTIPATKSESNKKSGILVILYVIFALALFAIILAVPATREVFKSLSSSHPYLMGFAKFALLATAGELIAVKLASGEWKVPPLVIARFAIWGVIGVWITYMMKIFSVAVAALMTSGALPGGDNAFLRALFISATMNLSFGPTFMAIHKCSDTYLALRASGAKDCSLKAVITSVDWSRFVSFTLFKTVPIFWIPAHTVTFLLPAEYQVMMAALLSVALGIILNIKKKKA